MRPYPRTPLPSGAHGRKGPAVPLPLAPPAVPVDCNAAPRPPAPAGTGPARGSTP
jgi:hypothetical protein